MKNFIILFALMLLGACARNAPTNVGAEYQNLSDVMVIFETNTVLAFEIKEVQPDSVKNLFYSDSCSLSKETVPYIEVGEGISSRNVTTNAKYCKELSCITGYVTLVYDNGLIYLPVLLTNKNSKKHETGFFKKVRISSDPRYQGIWCLVQVQEVD